MNEEPFVDLFALERALLVAVLDALITHPPKTYDLSDDVLGASAAAAIFHDGSVRTAMTDMVMFKVSRFSQTEPLSKVIRAGFAIPKGHPVSVILTRLLQVHFADVVFDHDLRKDARPGYFDDLKQHGFRNITFLEEIIDEFGPLLKGIGRS